MNVYDAERQDLKGTVLDRFPAFDAFKMCLLIGLEIVNT